MTKRERWDDKWILGGDFNDISFPEEKKRGRARSEEGCKEFLDFIQSMCKEEIEYQGRKWT